MQPLDYRQHNKRAWNELAKSGNRFARPANSQDFIDPLSGVDGPGWLGPSIAGKKVLCLAAGGGRQGPIYAAAGAQVTVVDISDEMLSIDRRVAQQKKLNLRLVETSMEDLSMFADAHFDIVIQPVSTCYVGDLSVVYDQIARIVAPGGLYISQHKQPSSLQSSIQPSNGGYHWLYPSGDKPLPCTQNANLVREPKTIEFAHSWQTLVGEMCRAGFQINDLLEPDHADLSAKSGSFEHRSAYITPYVRILAERNDRPARVQPQIIWAP